MIIGETVSHYRVIALLGAGGMGEVYKAEDTRLKRAVALKFLPPALVQDREAKERLVHEAQAVSALDHPNICAIHEIDETADGRLFLAMAYYEGETLKQRIARSPLSIDEALDIIAQVARAVAAAHDAGIIHRDIKPANIMLTRRGEVKLLDFGVAKLSGQTALTRTGNTIGTIAYMAPEQIIGQAADERSDVWALGVVLYEMLASGLPFAGEHEVAVLRAIANDQPRPLRQVRTDVPAAAGAIVDRALQKEAKNRHASAREFLLDVEALRQPNATVTQLLTVTAAQPAVANRRILIPAVVAMLVVVSLAGWFVYRNGRVRAARHALPELATLIDTEEFASAFRLMRRIEPYLSDDPAFITLQRGFLYPASIRTTPPGADLYMKPYADVNGPWEYLGRSPLDTRGPMGYFRWRITKAGFATLEGSESGGIGDVNFGLDREGTLPTGMVRVPGGNLPLPDGGIVRLEDFFIDRYEVTNREFKTFIDAGGYRDRKYWTEPFVKDGRTLSWEEASAEFRDATGRPGPSTWEVGSYPDGQDDFPVHGISWHEAAAYARSVGKSLPTVHHWRRAANFGPYSDILPLSNFAGKGPARVGSYPGIGTYGTYDMAGNVKEWCWNAVGDQRYILGGAWNEPVYQYRGSDARSPFDRSANNGFRGIKPASDTPLPEAALRPVERLARDYSRETPVSDDEFKVFARLYSYDPTDLKPAVESVDDSSPSWRVERITYAAAYGNERIISYLFLPKNVSPRYQTVVYFPHSGGLVLRSFQQAEMSYLGFVVKAGRALMFPMYKGTYERRLGASPSGPNAQRDLVIQEMKDLRRSVDYLETRADIDRNRLAYFGVSYGARLGPVSLATERRFKAAVVWSGGFQLSPSLPEVDPLNFTPRVTIPVLMLNGRDDFTFPIQASQLPMFRLLGTPDADKRHVLYDGGHVFPFARVEKDTLEWLDHYMGVTK